MGDGNTTTNTMETKLVDVEWNIGGGLRTKSYGLFRWSLLGSSCQQFI